MANNYKTNPRRLFLTTLAMSKKKESEKLLFILDCISQEFGVNKSFLICELIKLGLDNSAYKEKLESYEAAYTKICK